MRGSAPAGIRVHHYLPTKKLEKIEKSIPADSLRAEVPLKGETELTKQNRSGQETTQSIGLRIQKTHKTAQKHRHLILKKPSFLEENNLGQAKVMVSTGVQTEVELSRKTERIARREEISDTFLGSYGDSLQQSIKKVLQSGIITDKSLRPKTPKLMIGEKGRLCIVGERTGVESHDGIDITYRLGKNQISRSTWIRPKANFFSSEIDGGQIRPQLSRRTPETMSGIISSQVEKKVNHSLSKFDEDLSAVFLLGRNTPLMEDSNNLYNVNPSKVNKNNFERRRSSSQRVFEQKRLKAAGYSLANRFFSAQKQPRRLVLRDRGETPQAQMLHMQSGQTDGIRETFKDELSSVLYNSTKITSECDLREDSPVLSRTKASKIPVHYPSSTAFVSNYQNIQMKFDVKRDLAFVKGSQGNSRQSPSLEFAIPHVSKVRDMSSDRKISKIEKVLLKEVKLNLEKKMSGLGLFGCQTGKKAQKSCHS